MKIVYLGWSYKFIFHDRLQYNLPPNYYWLKFPTSIDLCNFSRNKFSSFPTAIIISNSIENFSTSAVPSQLWPKLSDQFHFVLSNFSFVPTFCTFQLPFPTTRCIPSYHITQSIGKFRKTNSGFYIGIGDFSISFFIQNWCSVEAQKFYY